MNMMKWWIALCAFACLQATASAETLNVAIGQHGAWETSVPELGQKAGFFKEQGLELTLLYTAGGGETMQAVVSGGADIGVSLGLNSVISAAVKGAPVRAISADYTGSTDLYWYAKSDSGITSFKDAAGKSVAYSTAGSSSNAIATMLVKQAGVSANMVATGSPPATLSMVMSGQVDIGWSTPPVALKEIESGKLRIVGRGSDVPELAEQTVRVLIANTRLLQEKPDTVKKFMKAYQQTIDWMYANPQAMQWYAEMNGVSVAEARKSVEGFHPKSALRLGEIKGFDVTLKQAIEVMHLDPSVAAQAKEKSISIVEP